MRPVSTNAKVTAGLKCPPEMAPRAATMTAIARPWANPMEARFAMPSGSPPMWTPEIARTPMKTNANAPIASATQDLIQFAGTFAPFPGLKPGGTQLTCFAKLSAFGWHSWRSGASRTPAFDHAIRSASLASMLMVVTANSVSFLSVAASSSSVSCSSRATSDLPSCWAKVRAVP